MTWIMGQSIQSMSLQMIQTQEWVYQMIVLPCRDCTGWRNRLMGTSCSSAENNAKACVGPRITPGTSTHGG